MKTLYAVCGAASIFLWVVATMHPAVAQDAQACARIDDSLRRLDCFDKMFPREQEQADAPKAEQPEPAAKSPWNVTEERSPIDDSPTVFAFLNPTSVSFTGIGQGEAYLLLRCSENTTAVVISTGMFMTEDRISVTIRIDAEEAETSRWNRSSNYKAVGLWNGATSIPLVKRLENAKKLVVRIQEDDILTAEYDLGDVSRQVEKIRAACNW